MLEANATVTATGGIPTPNNTTTTTTTTPGENVEIASFDHFRLPGFWHNSPTQWFTHADAMFANKRIRADLTRVNHVLEALDEDGVRTIADLLGPDAKYDTIRQRLVAAYSVPQSTRFQRMIQPGGMGDRAPSRLLRDMREIYPTGMTDSSLLAFWLSKLPPPVRTVIAGLTGSADFLAERADRVWEASQTIDISAVSRDHDSRESLPIARPITPASTPDLGARILALENAVHALTTQVASLATSQAAANAHNGWLLLLPQPVRRGCTQLPRTVHVRDDTEKSVRRRCSNNTSPHDSNIDSSSTTTAPGVDS